MRLTLSDIGVAYGSTWAVSGISLELRSRETYALMGPSGSGKSTLLAIISGQLEPTRGTMAIDGEPNPHVQWVFQSSPMLERRSVVDNVALSSIARGVAPSLAQARALELLETFGLADVAQRASYTLSGGQRQRAAIARAIAADPDILLADEPTASLDAVARDRVCDALEHAAAAGALVVVATHDDYVAHRCNRIVPIDPVHSR